MERKIKYALRGKLTRKEIKALKFEQNQKQAIPYLLVTSSRFWFEIFKRRPHLYQLHYFLLKVKRIRKGGNELIDILFDKLYAIHDQNFELAAALRDDERQIEQAFLQKHKIYKLENEYCTVKNGKVNLGIFYTEKQSRKKKNMDATQNTEVQQFLKSIDKKDIVTIDLDDIQPLYEKYKTVGYKQIIVNDFENYWELKRFINQILKKSLSIEAICLHFNDLTAKEISITHIGAMLDIFNYLNPAEHIYWGYARNNQIKATSDQVEVSILIFIEKK